MDLIFTYEAAPKCSRLSKVIEETQARRRDEAKLRLARIQNGKEPGYVKGGRCKGK
jgi:hypothetical protein